MKGKILVWLGLVLTFSSTASGAALYRPNGVPLVMGSKAGNLTGASPAAEDNFCRFGIRAGSGWGLGITGSSYGTNLATGNGWPVAAGNGLAWSGEALVALSRDFEIGTGSFSPLGYDETKTSSFSNDATGARSENTSSGKFSSLPICAMAYYKKQAQKTNFSAILGAGMGYSLGGDRTSSQETKNYSSGVSTGSSSAYVTTAMDGALAWRGMAGGEYAISRNFSLFLGVSLITASFSASSEKNELVQRDAAGLETFHSTQTTAYSSNPAPRSSNPSVTYQDNRVGGTGTVVQTRDEGNLKSIDTSAYQSGVLVSEVYESSAQSLKTAGFNITQLGTLATVTFRF